jgi:hypothetical protein
MIPEIDRVLEARASIAAGLTNWLTTIYQCSSQYKQCNFTTLASIDLKMNCRKLTIIVNAHLERSMSLYSELYNRSATIKYYSS